VVKRDVWVSAGHPPFGAEFVGALGATNTGTHANDNLEMILFVDPDLALSLRLFTMCVPNWE
jgi:hypothetical protein